MVERTFTVEHSDIGVSGGRYTGSSPYSVAAKAARALFKESKSKKTMIRFKLRETTQGSDGKIRSYIGNKVKLPEPKVVVRGDSKVTIEHVYRIKSCRA